MGVCPCVKHINSEDCESHGIRIEKRVWACVSNKTLLSFTFTRKCRYIFSSHSPQLSLSSSPSLFPPPSSSSISDSSSGSLSFSSTSPLSGIFSFPIVEIYKDPTCQKRIGQWVCDDTRGITKLGPWSTNRTKYGYKKINKKSLMRKEETSNGRFFIFKSRPHRLRCGVTHIKQVRARFLFWKTIV